MLHSTDRILTTHAGSLPRPRALFELLVARQRGEAVDPGALTAAIEAATRHAVAQQIAAGIDVGNDGEQGRESFVTYVRDRLSGFGGEHRRPVMRDITHFRSFLELRAPQFAKDQVSLLRTPQAIADVRHVDGAPLARELDTLARVLASSRAASPRRSSPPRRPASSPRRWATRITTAPRRT